MKEEFTAYVYSSLDFPRKTKCFLFFFIYHQQNNVQNKSGHKITNEGKMGSGRELCIISFFYSENYCNVLTLFRVKYYSFSNVYLGQLESK